MIITPAPTETMSQFTDDLFNKFIDFADINIIEIRKSQEIQSLALQRNNVIIVSKQLIDDYIFEKRIADIHKLNLDFIIFDENHFHGTTDMSKNILQSYTSPKTVKVFLTATYAKPLNEWNIPTDCQFYWDIEDEQLCKSRNIDKLIERHGPCVSLFLNEENKENILSIYDKMPNLHMITNMMDQTRFDHIKERIKDTSYGFSNSVLLSGGYSGEVDMILRYITGSAKEEDYPSRDLSIFSRIKKISAANNSRTLLNNADFTSQLWFLPFGINLTISKVSEHLKDRMTKNRILANYDIKIVNSKKEYKVKDIKEEIKNWEIKAKHDGKDGLILLAGNQLTLGITLPFVDIVVLFNDIISSDKIIQMMYRCMTESIHDSESNKINDKPKKMGFVVDMNISRVLNTVLDYNIHNKDLNVSQKIEYIVENNLISIDADLFESRENKTKLIEKLLHIWKSDPVNNLKVLMKKIEETIIEMDTPDQQLINKYFSKSLSSDKFNIKINFDDENPDPLQNGRKIEKNVSDCGEEKYEESSGASDDEKITEDNISLTKDVLPFIIPLMCILTMGMIHKDILEMLNIVISNPYLLQVFKDQSFIWWNKPDIIKLMTKLIEKYIQKNSYVYNISIQFKMSLHNLIDNPKELLELIDSCLKPKDIEKKKFGEVFTPMKLVYEMLDKLPSYVWQNKNLKWLDPCCGMGNFPIAVYLKLMDTLKGDMPSDDERKKHILENMIYISELNKKNIFIYRQIFNFDNKYKLNIYEGDSLKVDYYKEFNVKEFDIILGNPPYQKENKKNTTSRGGTNNNLYLEFISNAISLLKKDGYLLFIHPLNWRKIGSKIFAQFINRNIHYLKLNYGGDLFENVSVKTDYYVLKNSTNKNYTSVIEYINNKKIFTANVILSNTLKFIPNIFNEYINSILNKLTIYGKQYECVISSDCHKVRPHVKKVSTEIFKYPLFNTSGNPFDYFSSKPHKNQYLKKVIMSNSGKLSPFYDDGVLGTTQDSMYIRVKSKEEGNIIIDAINSKLFTSLLQICQWGNFRNEASLFSYFKYPNLEIINDSKLDDEFIYKYYDICDEEIKFIENIITKTTANIKIIEPDKNILNNPTVIKDGRKQYYLIDDKLYKIKKDKSQGNIFGSYIDGKIIKDIKTKKVKSSKKPTQISEEKD
jgi:adenine-specific DNA-methyltransferase